MTVNLSALAGAGQQFFDNSGNVLTGGKLYTYEAGTTTPAATYTTYAGNVTHANPIVLDAAGRVPGGEIWLTNVEIYKFVLQTNTNVLVATYDNISGIGPAVIDASIVNFTGFKSQSGTVQNLADNDGSNWVGYQQSGTGAVAESIQDKLQKIYDIRDYGGVPDDLTNTYTSLVNMKADKGGGITVKFPYVGGTQNIYRFNTIPFTIFNGLTLDVDEGVVLSFVNDGYLYMSDVYKVTRPFLSYAIDIESYAWISDERNRPITNKYEYLNYSDIDASTLKSVVCDTSELEHYQVAWPSGDTFTTTVPTATSVSGVQWTNPTTGSFHVSLARVQPGDEISVYFDGVVNPQNLTALVRGTAGYGGVYTTVTDTGIGTEQFQKNTGLPAVTGAVNYWGKGEHASYAGYRSVWTIRIVTWNYYVVLYNGMQVSVGAVNGAITDAGFGTYLQNPGSSCIVQDWTIRRNNNVVGTSNGIIVATFGDSITAERYECWPNYMREAIEGGLGTRVPTLINRAVSGDNAAGQWAVMNSQGLGGANIVVVQIGTNDIQAQTSKSSFLASLENMRLFCAANGATLIFGIPPMFYTRGQAGANHGQNSTNYELGAYIRSAVLRFCADNGVRCVDTNQYLGPILANYVNPALTPYWGGNIMNDPMVTDNIHPSVVMEKLLGLTYARAVLGSIATQGVNHAPNTLYSNAVALPATVPQNNWTFTTGVPLWYCDDDGNIEFSGVVDKSTGSLVNGTVIMKLPRNMWPRQPKRLICATNASTKPCMLSVSPTSGEVQIYGADATVTYVYLDGLIWNIKQN